MEAKQIVKISDEEVFSATGEHLKDVEREVLYNISKDMTYVDIAFKTGYSTGYVKQIASELWRKLSIALGIKVSKINFQSVLEICQAKKLENTLNDSEPEMILQPVKQEYEEAIKAIETKYEERLKAKEELIKLKDEQIAIYRQEISELLALVKEMAFQSSSQLTIEGHLIQGGNLIQGNRDVYVSTSETTLDLKDTAREIQQLLEQLSQTHSTKTLLEQAVVAEKAIAQIEQSSDLKERILQAIHIGGVEALGKAIKHPISNMLIAAIISKKVNYSNEQ